jgi:DNA-binding XRE family transcriptional regulator
LFTQPLDWGSRVEEPELQRGARPRPLRFSVRPFPYVSESLETVMGLAEKIKSLRYAKGWGPGKLAEVAGLSRTEIYQIEEGNRIEPRASTTKRLADALGVSVAELTEIER